jgi:hypothetical protein
VVVVVVVVQAQPPSEFREYQITPGMLSKAAISSLLQLGRRTQQSLVCNQLGISCTKR